MLSAGQIIKLTVVHEVRENNVSLKKKKEKIFAQKDYVASTKEAKP